MTTSTEMVMQQSSDDILTLVLPAAVRLSVFAQSYNPWLARLTAVEPKYESS
jgi:hypothetical protein